VRQREIAADGVLIRRIFMEHGAALLAYATRLLDDRPRAESVVQEVLVRAWRDPGALAGERGGVRAHLFMIVRELAVGARDAESKEDSMTVLSALEALAPEHREVLQALYVEGRDIRETAVSLGVPPETVKSRTYHALRRLREIVAQPLPAVDGATG
jgi:RNA polymerase sigma-70 factor (ECF subfamily)